MQLNAANRLQATQDQQLEARLDPTRDEKLKSVQRALRNVNIMFSMGMNQLYHKSNPQDIAKESEDAAAALNRLGFGLRINKPDIFNQPTFALKGKEGFTLQRVQNGIRIFYSI